MIWHRKGDKLLPEVIVTHVTDAYASPDLIDLLTVTGDAIWRQANSCSGNSLLHDGAKPLPGPVLTDHL